MSQNIRNFNYRLQCFAYSENEATFENILQNCHRYHDDN